MRVSSEWSADCDPNVSLFPMLLDARGIMYLHGRWMSISSFSEQIYYFLNYNAIMQVPNECGWEYCRRFLFNWQVDPVDVTPSLRDALWSREQSATKLVINGENWKKGLLPEPSAFRLGVDFLVHWETDATNLKNLKVHSDTDTRLMQTISPYGRRENKQANFDTAYFFSTWDQVQTVAPRSCLFSTFDPVPLILSPLMHKPFYCSKEMRLPPQSWPQSLISPIRGVNSSLKFGQLINFNFKLRRQDLPVK